MIPEQIPLRETRRWQDDLADLITDPAELLALLGLARDQLPEAVRACADFPLRVPRPFAARMRKGDPQDPLLLQALASAEELTPVPGYGPDPLAEADANPLPGIVHKYRGRLLLIAANQCAINCRYCFRRHFPYADNHPSRAEWQQALDYIRARPELREVILSGGDPLVLGDRQLRWLAEGIAAIPHVDKLRIHTRLPVVAPRRVTDELLQWFCGGRLKPVMVIHSNSAHEFDAEVGSALERLRAAGATLLNQSVLLRGVNDSATALAELSETLFQWGVMPYYLHQLDRVQGAAHFAVSDERAKALVAELRAQLPGYLVPQLVREIPGQPGKTPL
ncbi:EF-P beta-lysylation protein EpmB [Biformimicrobium ophioploci]|uniref:L-lysine 2,3-aminomutase n=1 Tax=Biformimicrobium ophioploci TaxID=3036711 RepID=A0ABQ6LUN3_9GAMM|nr:EF-P beta-lysylation protein EpmB [Microbulbifer sp. NKW57]GMG85796.1 EF-P beta-lysylation protein EpmB [Microbulbifer sp. NKW57]